MAGLRVFLVSELKYWWAMWCSCLPACRVPLSARGGRSRKSRTHGIISRLRLYASLRVWLRAVGNYRRRACQEQLLRRGKPWVCTSWPQLCIHICVCVLARPRASNDPSRLWCVAWLLPSMAAWCLYACVHARVCACVAGGALRYDTLVSRLVSRGETWPYMVRTRRNGAVAVTRPRRRARFSTAVTVFQSNVSEGDFFFSLYASLLFFVSCVCFLKVKS